MSLIDDPKFSYFIINEILSFSKFFFKSEIDSKRNFALNFSIFLNPKLVSLKSFGSILMKPIVLSDSLIDFEREILSNTLRLFLNQS